MKMFEYTITDELGIHARPAGLLAKMAKSYADTVIMISKGGNAVKASQLMMLMNLGVKQGDTVTISAEGASEGEVIAAMENFFKANL